MVSRLPVKHQSNIATRAPDLKVTLLHGGERPRHGEDLSGNDVVLDALRAPVS